jgi:hypothetical protein
MADDTAAKRSAGRGEREAAARELQQFLLNLGSALTAAGEAVNQVEEHLREDGRDCRALDHAPRDHAATAPGECDQRAGGDEEHQAGQEHAPAAEHVSQRARGDARQDHPEQVMSKFLCCAPNIGLDTLDGALADR